MFVMVIPHQEIVISNAALTRQLANWLVDRENGWLSSYQHGNVYAFDYITCLSIPITVLMCCQVHIYIFTIGILKISNITLNVNDSLVRR